MFRSKTEDVYLKKKKKNSETDTNGKMMSLKIKHTYLKIHCEKQRCEKTKDSEVNKISFQVSAYKS